MEYILDGIFSSWLLALIPIIIFFAIIMTLVLATSSFKNEKLNSSYKIILVLSLPVTLMTVMQLNESWGYGYADGFEDAVANKDWICFVTEGSFKMHRKNSGTHIDQRLNVLDVKTGIRLHRDVIGYFNNIIKLKGDTLFYKSGGDCYHLYNVRAGKEIADLSYYALPEMFKEFSSGVEECTYDESEKWIKIITKAGLTYYLELFSMKFKTEEPDGTKKHPDNKERRVTSRDLEIDERKHFKLENKKEGPLYQLIDEKENVIADNLLDASLMGNSQKLKRVIIRSYETTDKINFILSCFSYEGKLLWQVKQDSFNADDYFTKSNKTGRYAYTSTMDIHKMTGESFIFTIQGFVFSVDMNSGNLNWKARL
ncbi:MAG: hypothetical protein ABIP51_17620 [Bacteroidia bacterium]